MRVSVRISLLGDFAVEVDGRPVPSAEWSRRDPAALVKLLALTTGRLHREQVIETLWPGVPLHLGAPRLHKAAHHARRLLGHPGAVQLQQETVALFPEAELEVDARELLRRGREALAASDPAAAEAALALHAGPLLPQDPFEPWTAESRLAVESLHLELLRLAGRWADVLDLQPADEEAHLGLVRAYAARGDLRGARRQYERMEQALRHELGTAPSPEARRVRAELGEPARSADGEQPARVRLFGRRDLADLVDARLERAGTGRGGGMLLQGPAGVGKSTLLDLAESAARRRGWRSGRGSASAIEGSWPYAPVLEALGDLCRKHPALLDGLDDVYRTELDMALSGRELPWGGGSGHQRLFVAAAELVRLAAAGAGLLLVVDDLHEADEASTRLLHYLARCATGEAVLIAVALRPEGPRHVREAVDSLAARDPSALVQVPPLSADATRRLVAATHPDLPAEVVDEIWQLSAGLPFLALEQARNRTTGRTGDVLPPLPADVLVTFERVALLGTTFTTDEMLALAGVDEAVAYRQLEYAVASLLVEPGESGYRFRHPLIRESLVERMPTGVRLAARREVGETLAALGAPPARVAHQLLQGGLPSRAAPYVVQAVETAGALGAYRDALALVDGVLEHAPADVAGHLLARRGDLLMALGDPSALAAYRTALPRTTGTQHRLVRAGLARAAAFANELDTAAAALRGLELEGDAADGPILVAQGNLAFFEGDVDRAWQVASQARDLLVDPDGAWRLLDLVSLQGLIAHERGEWFERFLIEMRRTQGKDRLAVALFDAHLCVAEYLLYGPVSYPDVITQAEELRSRANHAGALRGVAFATALIGEAALLMGDVDRAERELTEAIELHRDSDAPAGEAHSLQRLAEVRLAQGDAAAARALLDQSLPLARWSMMSHHLLQRIYGTMIAAAPDPGAARVVVDRAEATIGAGDRCLLCDVMLEVPAAIACADVGDIADAERHLALAEESASRWAGSAWQAAILEVRARIAAASGLPHEAAELAEQAARLFESAGHVRDAERCRADRPSASVG
ncbi:AAA family ATPase [Nocardioides sp. MAH-18]|uniref:AAA family ATPase n=1 Tax=Nocardioides agri TaxID=2682843 RepID=A0A6L6XNN4_9ACTN|nr:MULTISPECIES: AAA family ATPase [unclassified Nocardioides]MBA2953338.1 AAA family ATPase [Nocardioides sp. CGMCC 1.13656]MVQ48206.1 AAA family ATPase [Nocardioides sp. MAH-18]